MAKVTDIKFEFQGKDNKIAVNVNSEGRFKCNLPKEISTALKMPEIIEDSNLQDLTIKFRQALERYKNASTEQTIYIAVKYASNGVYAPNSVNFGSPYYLNSDMPAIALDFKTVMLEVVDGVETWYHAGQGKEYIDRGLPNQFENERSNPDKWFKRGEFYSRKGWKIIDYNEVYLETLNKAKTNMINLSQMLHKFMEQDKEQMQLTLSAGKLLLN